MKLENMLHGLEKINIGLKYFELLNPDIVKPLYKTLDDLNNCTTKDDFAKYTSDLTYFVEENFMGRDGGTDETVKDFIKTVEDFSEWKYYKLTYK